MSNTWFHKPENALRRANELIGIGNKNAALELLHGVFTARRYKTWQKAYETIMIKYLDLCVELQQHRQAKDGLHQYRNMAQPQAPGSLEVIINHLVNLAEERAANARKQANSVALAAATQIGDLEAEVSPESIMLSTMTEEGERERQDRELVVPWLKFLWETYRAVLDILKTNTKLEHVYHNTCVKAFNFCKIYDRKTEFRRLCDTLRQHIQNLQKHTAQQTTSRLRGWEGWTNESIELHLQTRFAQLEVSATLELWTEGFRTVEDIYNIMQIGKKQPKARLMASYFEKLTRIFWVSDNYLFHAYAWYKYYTLSREYNKALTPEERTLQASCVLLAALAIPDVKAKNSGTQLYDEDDLTKEKHQRMATLLGFNTNPSRANLLNEIVSKGMLAQVPAELRSLYEQLEIRFHPLTMVQDVKPTLDYLTKQSEALSCYVVPLSRVVVLRLLEQLASIYHTVSLDNVNGYLKGLDVSQEEVEKIMVRAVKGKMIRVSVDHQSKCLRFFGDAVLETDTMRSQLTSLARQLNKVVAVIAPEDKSHHSAERMAFFDRVMSSMQREHLEALSRKQIIEKRKEEQERREQDKLREEARLRAEEEQKRKEEEAKRLDREARLREKEKQQKAEDEMALAETKAQLARLGKDVSELDSMDKGDREELIRKTRDEARKQRDEDERKLKDSAKRLDHITRALRMEELPILQAKYAKQVEVDRAEHEKRWAEHLVSHKEQYEKDKQESTVVAHMQAFRGPFEESIMAARKAAHEQEVRRAEARARKQLRRDKVNRAKRRMEEAFENAEREREEAAEREREEKERERREAAAAEKKAREDEQAALRQAEEAARGGPRDGGYGRDREPRFGGGGGGEERPWRGPGGAGDGMRDEGRRDDGYTRREGAREEGRSDGVGAWRRTGPPPVGGGERRGDAPQDRGFDRDRRDERPPERGSTGVGAWRPNRERQPAREGDDRGFPRRDAPPPREGGGAEAGAWRPRGAAGGAPRDGGAAPPAARPAGKWGGGRTLAELDG